MRRLGPLVALGVSLGAVAMAAAAGSSGVTVRPASGMLHTRFVVRFRAPAASGRQGSVTRSYEVNASGPSRRGCDAAAGQPAQAERAGQPMRVTLSPEPPGQRWCRGLFAGMVQERIAPECSAGRLCPLYVASRVLGRFRFRVK